MEDKTQSICVDMDGTLLYYTSYKGMGGRLGKPRPGAKEFLQELKKLGRVIIFTARLGRDHYNKLEYDTVAKHLRDNDLYFDEIYIGQGKPDANCFIDDRAIEIPKNPVESDYDWALDKVKRYFE